VPQPRVARFRALRFAAISLAFLFHFIGFNEVVAQAPAPPASSVTPASQNSAPASAPEVSQDTAATYKLNVNLVLVRVVVRDPQGKPVPNLKKEDFLLFDNRKIISTFSVETPASRAGAPTSRSAVKSESESATAGASSSPANAIRLPQRFVALFFDDVHLTDANAVYTKQAAIKFLSSLAPSDRVAAFTSSGRLELQFTSDRDNPDHLAYEEIDQALTSQDELRELPLQCETQIFKNGNQARLSVVVRIDTKTLKFRRVDDRNHDNLKVIMALFDNNGNILSGMERGITLQLKDTTLAARSKTGIRVKLNFDTQSGTYMVRVVVRDSEGAQLGATSQGVVIPD